MPVAVIPAAVIGVLDLLVRGPYSLMPLLAAVPALALLRPSEPRRVVVIAAAVAVAAVPPAVQHWPERPVAVSTSLLAAAFSSLMMWIACRRHQRGERARAELRRVAETMRRAVLRPVPGRLGPVTAEVRYLAAVAPASQGTDSAAGAEKPGRRSRPWARAGSRRGSKAGAKAGSKGGAEADAAGVGGDLYDMVATPFGVRVIVGDVMGKGLPAVEAVADVLGAFRELAQHERDLAGVAVRLDAFLATRGREEEFVTVLLAEVPGEGGIVRLVNCGHPPPLLLSDGTVAFADLPAYASSPPLGLLGVAGSDGPVAHATVPFGPGDGLLLYTDGVGEARDPEGRFYPLAERVGLLNRQGSHELVRRLERDLRAHVGGVPGDDAALLLLRMEPVPASLPGSPLEPPHALT
ncbi:PP2C family protein-serine/threonine phosphatase [Spirillospora sp. CA-255316]